MCCVLKIKIIVKFLAEGWEDNSVSECLNCQEFLKRRRDSQGWEAGAQGVSPWWAGWWMTSCLACSLCLFPGCLQSAEQNLKGY